MQRIPSALWAFLMVFLLFSCKKNPDVTDGGSKPAPVGEVTPVGEPDDQPGVEKTIGAGGGTLTSTDGRLKVTIPAGALTSNQVISIQSISNENPLPVAAAYRLQPHGLTFGRPVTLEFNYGVYVLNPENLGIACQDEKGVWQAQGGVVLDKEAKTLKVTTTHFSDWSLFESFFLYSSGTVAQVNGTVDLEVFTIEDLLVPLTPGQQAPLGKKVSVKASQVKEWKLAGAGNLQGNGSTAVYRAPSTVPNAPNPVAVSVRLELNAQTKFLLVRHIEIQNDDGEIEIRVAGGGWKKKTASPAVRLGNGIYAIGDSDGDTEGSYVFITWEGGTGTHPFKDPMDPVGTHTHYHVTGANNYTCSYLSGEELVASGGGVTITSMGEDDGFIKGTFSIQPAGFGDFLRNTIGIEGKFRVRKGWQ